jgi:hypothetical protein
MKRVEEREKVEERERGDEVGLLGSKSLYNLSFSLNPLLASFWMIDKEVVSREKREKKKERSGRRKEKRKGKGLPNWCWFQATLQLLFFFNVEKICVRGEGREKEEVK